MMVTKEATRPWKLCPYPERWRAEDPWTVEDEILPFLTALVGLHKPEIIVETGTYLGATAKALAEGCRKNGFGHVWTYDIEEVPDPDPLGEWITLRREDARTTAWDGPPIELLYCDGGMDRAAEILNFLPHFAMRCLVVAHDAANADYGWRKLETVFLPVMIPSARGLWIMRRFLGEPIARPD